MKNKKVLKRITIILSIIVLLIDICLYIKMKSTWSEIGNPNHQYEDTSLIIVGIFRYATLIWGLLLILVIWLEYFLIILLIKIYNKFDGWKKLFLCLIISAAISTILVFFIKIVSLIVISL